MTERQKKFCDEYLIDMNGTQAAIRAGYSKKTANVIANENLMKPYIKAYIDQRLKEMENQRIATATEVMMYLTSVVRGQSESEVVVVEGIGDGCSEARRVKKAPDEKEKLKAAELLGKRFGMFKENLNLNAVPVVISGENDLQE